MHLILSITLILILGMNVSFSNAEEKNTVYVSPDQIKGLPSTVVSELEKLHCRIPQGLFNHTNAIEGEFAIRGQKDWAVLCSKDGISHIHIFWGGYKKCHNEIAARPDNDYLYKPSGGDWEDSRGLGNVGKEFIVEHYEAYGGPKPPPITHDAIDDRYLEKASVVHYCEDGKWIELTGAD